MRPRTAGNLCAISIVTSLSALAFLASGCRGPAPAEPSTEAPPATPADATGPTSAPASAVVATGRAAAFSADRAWRDLVALTEIGTRVTGSDGNAKAASYIEAELQKLDIGAKIDEYDVLAPEDPPDADETADSAADAERAKFIVRNVEARIPAAPTDQPVVGTILLMAPYDTQHYDDFTFVGANDGGSGAAVLLELARVIAADPLPYATEIVFLDAHARITPPGKKQPLQHAGEFALARHKQDEDVEVRLVLYLNRVGDADLRIARDLLSHRIYREQFWKVSARTGHQAAFPPDAAYESSGLAHRALSAAGVRRIVSFVDTRFGGDEPPGLYAGTADDTLERCSPQSLGAVGSVSLGGLEQISEWLMRIDMFSALGQTPPDEAAIQPTE